MTGTFENTVHSTQEKSNVMLVDAVGNWLCCDIIFRNIRSLDKKDNTEVNNGDNT